MVLNNQLSGTDIHVVGYEVVKGNWIAKYWMNGVDANLNDGTNNAAAYSVFVSGSDVYVAGWEESVATYWKKMALQQLQPNESDGATIANSIFVSGKDVYVAGVEYPDCFSEDAIYWKNGVATSLAGNNWSFATSSFVTGSNV